MNPSSSSWLTGPKLVIIVVAVLAILIALVCTGDKAEAGVDGPVVFTDGSGTDTVDMDGQFPNHTGFSAYSAAAFRMRRDFLFGTARDTTYVLYPGEVGLYFEGTYDDLLFAGMTDTVTIIPYYE